MAAAASAAAQTLLLLLLLLFSSSCSYSSPILAPELKYCHLPLNLPDGETPFNCCAPDWDLPAIEYVLPNASAAAVRRRLPAHLLNETLAAKLDRAYALMRSLPSDDPRSFRQQANIHCAYCSAAYQMGNSSMPLQVHASWLFFSFHRWYLYFHERILAHLLDDDPHFALPFWNYDHPDGMTIPQAFVLYPNLTDAYRDPSRLPPATVMIDYYYMNASIRTSDEQIAANLATIHRMVVSGAPTQYSFHGAPYRQDSSPEPGYGTVETMPHNSVHGWTGDHKQVGGKDMGTLYAAGRDPVFYAHHANIDRLWEVWKSLDGNQDIDDEDYLNSEFVFYNEYAQLVKVKVKDSLDPLAMGFTYADVDNLWLNISLPTLSSGAATLSDADKICVMGEELTEPCSVELSRSAALLSETVAEEVLVVEGIEGVLTSAAHFEVFVNLPEAAVIGASANCTEFVGRFSTLPQVVYTEMTGNNRETSVKLAVGANIEALGLEEAETIVVTLVPRVEEPYVPVTIGDVRLSYEKEGLSKAKKQMIMMKKKIGGEAAETV